jgi:hypothetical protein
MKEGEENIYRELCGHDSRVGREGRGTIVECREREHNSVIIKLKPKHALGRIACMASV